MRRTKKSPFSLFSFQDIITGLCGIMIFMVLVQVVGLVVEKDFAAPVQVQEADSSVGLDALCREVGELERKLDLVREKSALAIVVPKDRVRPGEVAKLEKEMTEKERIVAALVSQVHDLETQVEKARDADAEDREKVKEMERARRLLEQQIASMKKRRGVTLIPERGDAHIPVYVVCSGRGAEVWRPFEKGGMCRRFDRSSLEDELASYFDALDHTTHSVVLLVRPTGVAVMDKVVELLKALSFTYGRDPLEEDVEIAFGKGVE